MTLPAAVASLTGAFERLGIAWFVGGSVASVVYGEIRTTQDVDIVADLAPAHVPALAAALAAEFFVDAEFLAEAVRTGTSCNLIHRTTGFKVDVFVLRKREFSRVEMARRVPFEFAKGQRAYLATVEDCVLTKLEWYGKGGRVSDRQWRDVLGLLKGREATIDRSYLQQWAPALGVGESLQRALREAGYRSC